MKSSVSSSFEILIRCASRVRSAAGCRKAVPGSLRWATGKGMEYLYRKSGKSERSLGRRSRATEVTMSEHDQLKTRVRQTGVRLRNMARVNRALYLTRVPRDAALILRELDAAGLLGICSSSAKQ